MISVVPCDTLIFLKVAFLVLSDCFPLRLHLKIKTSWGKAVPSSYQTQLSHEKVLNLPKLLKLVKLFKLVLGMLYDLSVVPFVV